MTTTRTLRGASNPFNAQKRGEAGAERSRINTRAPLAKSEAKRRTASRRAVISGLRGSVFRLRMMEAIQPTAQSVIKSI